MGQVALDALFSLHTLLRLREGSSSPLFAREIERIYRELAESLGCDPQNPIAILPVSPQFVDDLKDLCWELDRLLQISARSACRIVLELREHTRYAGATGAAAHILRVAALGEPPRPDPMGDRAAFDGMCRLREVLRRTQDGQCSPTFHAEVKEAYCRMTDALGRDPDDPNAPMARSVQQEVRDLLWELQQLAEIYPWVARPITMELCEKRQMVEAAWIALNILNNAASGTPPREPD